MKTSDVMVAALGILGLVLLAHRESTDIPPVSATPVPGNTTPPPVVPPVVVPASGSRVTYPGHYQVKLQSQIGSGGVGYSNIDFPNAQYATMEAYLAATVQNKLTILGVKVYRSPFDTAPITAGELETVRPYPGF